MMANSSLDFAGARSHQGTTTRNESGKYVGPEETPNVRRDRPLQSLLHRCERQAKWCQQYPYFWPSIPLHTLHRTSYTDTLTRIEGVRVLIFP